MDSETEIKSIPVFDKDGSVLLYDLFVNKEWIGSRRTVKQSEEWLSFYIGRKTTKEFQHDQELDNKQARWHLQV
jgi:hypothetical protein